MMADLYIPPKPAIIRATELPRSPAEARGIALREAFGPALVFMVAGAMARRPQGPVHITYLDGQAIDSTTSTYNFTNGGSGFSIGAEAPDRRIGVALMAIQTGSVSVSSIVFPGSVGANVLYAPGWTPNRLLELQISDYIPTGATIGSVVVTLSGNALRCGISLFRITGLKTVAAQTTHNTTAGGAPGTQSLSVTVGDGWGILAATFSSAAPTWTGLTGATAETLAAGQVMGAASAGNLSAEANRSIQATNSYHLIAATLRP